MLAGIPISRTKILVPRRRAEIVSRPRLLDMFHDLLEKKLILISAAAGYGKTSLLIDLAHHTEMPVCWFSLDELDRDPQRFIAYFIASIAQRFPEFGKGSAATLSATFALEEDLERLLITLVNEMVEHIHEHFVIVVDDFHLVDDVPLIQKFLNRFVQLADENCHLILSSRTLITLPDLPLMIARHQVDGLSFAELAFRPSEIQALLKQNYDIHLSDDAAEALARESEGWITGLLLSTTSLPQEIPERLRVARAAGVGLFDYLGQQVFEQQPPAMREFLLRTSLLGEFNAEFCKEILDAFYSEPPNWDEMVQAVLRNNLFVLPVGTGGQWLRYHHLFQEFLQERIRTEQPELTEAILLRLAQAYERRQEWDKAYHTYQQLGDMEALANLIERAGSSMLQRAFPTLRNWLNDLPPALIRQRPGLISLQGTIVSIAGDVHQGIALFDQAVEAFRAQEDFPNLALTLVRRATAHRYMGNYQRSLQDTEEAMHLTEHDITAQATFAEALRVKGLSLQRLGHAREAISFLERSLALYRNLGEEGNIPIVQMELGTLYFIAGRYREAEETYEEALHIWQREGNLNRLANLWNNLGVLYHARGMYEKAVLAFEQGIECARRTSYTRVEGFNLTSLGDLYAELGIWETAWEAYQQAIEIASRIADRFLLVYLSLAQAKVARLQGETQLASNLLEEAKQHIGPSGSLHEKGLYYLERGCLLLMEDAPRQAIPELQEALSAFERSEATAEKDHALLWLALAAQAAGEETLAQEVIRRVARRLRESPSPRPLHVALHQARSWLTSHPAIIKGNPTIGQLLHEAGALETELAAARRRLRRLSKSLIVSPPHLHIRALGRARVEINGKALTLSDWQTQSVRDLFFFFLQSSQPLTREQVCLVLWPEIEEPERQKLRFKNDLYRLRRAVGQKVILFEDEHYRFNRALDYEYDVEAFDAYIKQAHSADETAEKIQAYRKAIALVEGPYLQDIDATWAWPERERLNRAYLSALLALADLYLQSGQTGEAITLAQRALEWDSCLEEAHRLLMRAYARQGDRPAIVRQYRTCKDTLRTELDVSPSPETERLYRRLTA